jgi:hypothetical protein
MERAWIHKAKSFREAEEFDLNYYASMSPSKRIETVQYLRESWLRFGRNKHGNGRKRLRRVFRIIKQA